MADVYLRLLTDVSKATKSVESFTDTATSAFKGLAVAAAGIFTAAKIAQFFKEATEAAVESEKSITRLNVALKLTGDFTEGASKDFQDFASQIQKTTEFSDDAVLSQITLAKQFGVSNSEAKKLVKAAIDLSAATGIDLDTATRSLGQTLDGTAGRIAEQIPLIKNLSAEQLRAGAAVELVANRFAGAGEAIGQTFSGRLAQLENSFGDFLKVVGRLFTNNNIVLTGFEQLSVLFGKLATIVENNKESILGFFQDLVYFSSVVAYPIIKTFKILDAVFTYMISRIELFIATVVRIPAAFDALKASITARTLDPLKQFAADAGKDIDDQIKKGLEGLSARAKGYDDLADSIYDFGKSVRDATSVEIDGIQRATDAIDNQTKAVARLSDAQLKALQSNPFGGAGPGQGGLVDSLGIKRQQLSPGAEQGVAIGSGLASSLLSGKEGAVQLGGTIVSAIGTAFLGPIGAIFGEIFKVLAQGPEKVREMVTAFIRAIPEITRNVILAIPELILTLLEELPNLVEKLVEDAPKIIIAIIEKIPDIISALITKLPAFINRFIGELIAQTPNVAIAFINALIKEVPRLIVEIVKAIPRAIGGSVTGIGGGIISSVGNAIKGVGKIFGFAEGGLVPGGFPNDTFPARLTSGEFVANNELTDKLNKYLAGQQNNNQPVQVVLNVGERELASVLLNLNKSGFRTA